MEQNAAKEIGITLDKYSRTPIYEQVVEQFKKQILTGELVADDLLPSVRNLSVALGVNPNTLLKAYAELDRLNLSYTVAGNGRFVHPDAKNALQRSEADTLYENLQEVLQKLTTAGQSKEAVTQAVRRYFEMINADKETTNP